MRSVILTSGPQGARHTARATPGLGQARATNSALDAPPPAPGEVVRTALPDTFDGIRFEIGRMRKYVQAVKGDAWMAAFAREICAKYSPLAGSVPGADRDERVRYCEALDLWCRDHYAYVNDPPNIEVIQTPKRMVKQTMVPREVIKALMAPFYEEFAGANPNFYLEGYVPPPLYIGDCDEAVCCYLGLCVAMPGGAGEPKMGASEDDGVRTYFRFGGNDGTLHHVWGRVRVNGQDIDADHTEPGYKIGDFSRFEAYESAEVPL